jgi:hypothetical protein
MGKNSYQCRRYINTRLQLILQRQSNKNSMVLAPQQIRRSMEQTGRPRNKAVETQPSDFLQRSKKHPLEKRQLVQKMVLGKLAM